MTRDDAGGETKAAPAPVSAAEARTLFAGLDRAAALILAISGGADSTALLALAVDWRAAFKRGPELIAVTIDHGFRAQLAREAPAVQQLAGPVGGLHRTLRWAG